MRTSSPAVQLGSIRRIAPLPADAPFYRRLWHAWQAIARVIGNLLSRIVTSVAFVVLLPLFAIGVRLFSDPLQLKPRPARWIPLPPPPSNIDEARLGL
ncbi:MAG: hypothetical protein HYR73_04095 [Candidatus Eisenbacteria bacterium]|nr:hypothetical protein [Candidatus Eisenbacteria bacterium]